jgi:hypothetical protein
MTEYTQYEEPKPNPDQPLERLVGTWKQSGGVEGEITYEWMEGGFFLTQHVDLVSDGRKIKGIEVIGHLQLFGEEPSKDIKSRFFSFLDGMTLDYVYEIVDIDYLGGEQVRQLTIRVSSVQTVILLPAPGYIRAAADMRRLRQG